MNDGWIVKKLSEVCEKITDGTHQTPKYFNNGVIFLSSKNVTSGRINWEDIKYIDEKQHFEMHKRVSPRINDILLAKNGTTGVAAIVDKDVVFDIYVSLALLRPLKGLHPFYLLHFINSPLAKQQFNKRLKGIGVPNLHLEEIREVEIPIPPLAEQKRIVAFLDSAFAAIDKAKANIEKNLQNAREFFESYLQNVFANRGGDWTEQRLGEVFIIKPAKSEVKKGLKESDAVSFLPMEDLNVLAYNITAKQERKLKDVVSSYTYFANNDVLLAKITPCFENGKIGIARNLTNGVGFGSSEYIVFRSKGEIVPEYLYYFLSRDKFREKGKKRMTGAVGHKRVAKEFVEEYIIPYPKIVDEQMSIVCRLEGLSHKIERLKANYQKKLSELDELKKSILQKAFAGELTVRNIPEFV
jgi:type I restriction enzyme S subunit